MSDLELREPETAPRHSVRPQTQRAGFGVVLCDPPWAFENWSERGTGRAASRHYDTQRLDWILSLPVLEVMARDSVLLLWATNPLLPEAFEVVSAWGFTYKTCATWVKMSRAAAPRIGCGYHLRGATEHLLIATRGEPGAPNPSCRLCSVIFNPIGEHSAKPDAQYAVAENYAGPYLELFHRSRDGGLFGPRPGWVFLGNEVTGRDLRTDLEALAAEVVQ